MGDDAELIDLREKWSGAHRDAGADHVAIKVIGVEPGHSAIPSWRMLGDALLAHRART